MSLHEEYHTCDAIGGAFFPFVVCCGRERTLCVFARLLPRRVASGVNATASVTGTVTERAAVSLYQSLATGSGAMMVGGAASGKTEVVRAVSRTIGRAVTVVDAWRSQDATFLTRCIMAAFSGYV
jgi:hypothetical protein